MVDLGPLLMDGARWFGKGHWFVAVDYDGSGIYTRDSSGWRAASTGRAQLVQANSCYWGGHWRVGAAIERTPQSMQGIELVLAAGYMTPNASHAHSVKQRVPPSPTCISVVGRE